MDKATENTIRSIEKQLHALQSQSNDISDKLSLYHQELDELQKKHHYTDLHKEQTRLENDIFVLTRLCNRTKVQVVLQALASKITGRTTRKSINAWFKRNKLDMTFVTENPKELLTRVLDTDLGNCITTQHGIDGDRQIVHWHQDRIIISDSILDDLTSFEKLCKHAPDPDKPRDLKEMLTLEQRRELYDMLRQEFESEIQIPNNTTD